MNELRCQRCGAIDELRMGVCFDCASRCEKRRAMEPWYSHLLRAFRHLLKRRCWWKARLDLKWAKQSLTQTGDFKPGGYLDREYPGWRQL